jgi:hypothetical protein
LRQLQRLHNLCETATRPRHDIVSSAHPGNFAFQTFEQRSIHYAIKRHGIGYCRPRPQQTLYRHFLALLVMLHWEVSRRLSEDACVIVRHRSTEVKAHIVVQLVGSSGLVSRYILREFVRAID